MSGENIDIKDITKPTVFPRKLKNDSRVVLHDGSIGTFLGGGEKIIRVLLDGEGSEKKRKKRVGIDKVKGVFARKEEVKKIGESLRFADLIIHSKLVEGTRVIVQVRDEAWEAVIVEKSDQDGVPGYRVNYVDPEGDQEWVPRGMILDVVLAEEEDRGWGGEVIVSDQAGKVDFMNVGVHYKIDVLVGEEGTSRATVEECCQQGLLVTYDNIDAEDSPKCWVTWNLIINTQCKTFEDKVEDLKQMVDTIIELAKKNEKLEASEKYVRVCGEGGHPPKMWLKKFPQYPK
jgi:hypothetical protein